eukprot:749263-Hanusia_phi.AAC.7
MGVVLLSYNTTGTRDSKMEGYQVATYPSWGVSLRGHERTGWGGWKVSAKSRWVGRIQQSARGWYGDQGVGVVLVEVHNGVEGWGWGTCEQQTCDALGRDKGEGRR